jgi:amino acid transporter
MTEGLRTVRMRLTTVVAMIFIFVSSGPFGLEDMVSSSGPGLTLLMLLALPLFYALPQALVCSELASALPQAGGYYRWVRRAMGEFWGFQCGWWSWTCQWVDSAVYIALVEGYVSTWWPQLSGWQLWLIGAAIIAVFAFVNIRGLDIVAFSSVVFTIVILTPFVVMTILGLVHWHHNPFQPIMPRGQSFISSVNLGLAVGVWMYSGFDSMSTLAAEVKHPQRLIPKALMIALPLIVLSYLLPTLAGLAGVGNWHNWATAGGTSFVEAMRALGGRGLGWVMLGAAVISNLALYQDYLASGSRPAFAMAEDRLLPKMLNRTHHKYGTPWISILLLAAINMVLIIGTFANLVVIDVMLNMSYYLLIFAAAVRLRHREPNLARPFRVRGGTATLALICAPAVAIIGLTVYSNAIDRETLLWGLPALLSGPAAYAVVKAARGGRAGVPSETAGTSS